MEPMSERLALNNSSRETVISISIFMVYSMVYSTSTTDALNTMCRLSLNNVPAQQIFAKRRRTDESQQRDQQRGFEIQRAVRVDAAQDQQHDRIDVQRIQRQDAIWNTRAALLNLWRLLRGPSI